MNTVLNISKIRNYANFSPLFIPKFYNNVVPSFVLNETNNFTSFKINQVSNIGKTYNERTIVRAIDIGTGALEGTSNTYVLGDNTVGLQVGAIYEIELYNGTDYYYSDLFSTIAAETTEGEVIIGTQTWQTTELNIDDGGGGIASANLDSGNDEDYGFLYTYEAAVRVAALISGFRIPSRADYDLLFTAVTLPAGGAMKEQGLDHWNTPNVVNDDSGYRARGAGYITPALGFAGGFKTSVYFWTTSSSDGGTTARVIKLQNSSAAINSQNSSDKEFYYSVRLIKE